jgi:RNA polymerase sigma-70 factor (ECF subfamily)
VNSALQRARAALADVTDPGAVSETSDTRMRTVVDRYMRAFESADVPGLVELLAADAVLEMPPVPLWYRGRGAYEAFMHRVFEMRGPGWQMHLASANGQPALAAYAPARSGPLAYHSLQVLTVADDQVTRNVTFADPRLAAVLGLPAQVPPGNPG